MSKQTPPRSGQPESFETPRRGRGVTSDESRVGRAQAVLKQWETSRQPFLLYLRTFHTTMYHGPDQRMLLENHFWATLSLHGIGVLTVIDPQENPLPGSLGHGAPALALSNDQWQDIVSDLIEKAEVIVSEIPLLTSGAAFELNTCIEKGKIAQTVVIIPSPDGPFPALDDEPLISRFPRVIYYGELPKLGAKDHFVFRDLVARARCIASLGPAERKALTDAGRLGERFPVTFSGLREGYEAAAADYEAAAQRRMAARSYFRALVVASAQKNDSAAAAICEEVARLAVMMGDREAALNYLRGGISIAVRAGDEPRRKRLEERLQQFGENAA